MDVREKVEVFLKTFGMPKATFCRKVGVSTSGLYSWQRGKLEFSQRTLGRIEAYLAKYNSVLENEEVK